MTKIRKNVIGAILCLVMLLVGVCAFTACGSKDLSVTFTVEGKTQTLDVVNGKVTMPADPEKEFYEFRGWYTTSTFDEGTEFTKDTEVKENLTVYAYFAPVHVGISVNGEAATDISSKTLPERQQNTRRTRQAKTLRSTVGISTPLTERSTARRIRTIFMLVTALLLRSITVMKS